MSSKQYKTTTVPVVSPPPIRPALGVSVATCVGRSLNFASAHLAHDEKENADAKKLRKDAAAIIQTVGKPHARADCGICPFRSDVFTPGINGQHCSNCICFVCDLPADQCTQWTTGEFHCDAYKGSSFWTKLTSTRQHKGEEESDDEVQYVPPNTSNSTATALVTKKNKATTVIPASPPPAKKTKTDISLKSDEHETPVKKVVEDVADVTVSEPKFKIDKYSVDELKEILRVNGQHITGRKDELIARILDGEKYGRLATCPDCDEGRLKVRPHHPGLVFCPGYYDSYYNEPVHCGYTAEADEAPRRGDWHSPPLRRLIIPEVSPTDKIKAEYKKKSKKELADLVAAHGQYSKGPKKLLLERIVDGKLRGFLAECPDCERATLCFDVPDQVICYRKGCGFNCPADVAPRNGEWQS